MSMETRSVDRVLSLLPHTLLALHLLRRNEAGYVEEWEPGPLRSVLYEESARAADLRGMRPNPDRQQAGNG